MALPNWIFPPLQGITFWVSHRRTIYPKYPLGESALIAELCNLTQTHLPNDHELKCEVSYKSLSNKLKFDINLTKRARTDLVVYFMEKPSYVFEVKRASAGNKNIEKDLLRLAKLKFCNSSIRVFLIIVSEAQRPENYVSNKGVAIRGNNKLNGTKARWRVRSVKKAAHSFKNKNSASYACLIEVLI